MLPDPHASLVSLNSVTKTYRSGKAKNQVLFGVNLDVALGEFVAISGTSGSGKTTLLNVIGGLDRIYDGTAIVLGNDLSKLSDVAISQLRNEHIGFVFQQFHLLEHVSCLENVFLPALFSRTRTPAMAMHERALRVLDRVNMGEKAHELPVNLSGGQKQRVAIARALFQGPRLLLCDEPTGNLDKTTGGQIIELFKMLNKEDKITLIIVTHETRVSEVAHRTVSIEDGRMLPQSSS